MSEGLPEGWETVIGLEVHTELATATKIFCGCANTFGDEPNTNICPVCMGLPGSLPVLNEQVVELAMRIGLALHCSVEPSVFARKNYFYPDMPKDYQVSQFDLPINVDGYLELPDGTRIGIERAHIEEDTGKSTHMGGSGRIHGSGYSLVDYNRAGVPLVEIVGRPDIRTAEHAKAYVSELRAILVATGASDARMEQGSLRVDANISVRRVGDPKLGTRCEVKNLNSLRSLGRAIDYEARRQIELIEAGESVRQETRHWDEDAGRTRTGRSKEEADDYRYFPEPDLVPLAASREWIDSVASALPRLPAQRRADLADAVGGGASDPAAIAIVVERDLDTLALATIAAGGDPWRVLNHIEHNLAVEGASQLDAIHFAHLVGMELAGELTATQTKQVLAEMVETGKSPEAIAAEHGFEAMGADELSDILDRLIAEHGDEWASFVEADDKKRKKLSGFFTGKIMAMTKGQADGRAVAELLDARRSG